MVQKYCGREDGGKTENPPGKSRRQEGYCCVFLGAKGCETVAISEDTISSTNDCFFKVNYNMAR